jgi:hypothetical protein
MSIHALLGPPSVSMLMGDIMIRSARPANTTPQRRHWRTTGARVGVASADSRELVLERLGELHELDLASQVGSRARS